MLNFLIASTSGTAFFLSFLLFAIRRGTNTNANRWLAGFVLMLGFLFLDTSFSALSIYQEYPATIGFFEMALLAAAPTLYLGVSHFVAVDKKFKRREWWHFFPCALFLLLSMPFLFSNPRFKLQELHSHGDEFNQADQVMWGLIVLQIAIYWGLSLRKLQQHRRHILRITAAPEEFDLDWLLYLLYGIAALVLVWILDVSLWGLTLNATVATPIYLILIWYLGYFALQQKEIFPFSPTVALELGQVMTQTSAEPNSRRLLFDPKTLAALKSQVLQKMQDEKPFLDPELNLPKLAQHLNLSVHEMSELVNEGFGENFAQFVNRYRVEESKHLLRSPKHAHLSMVGIAYEAGFNSKTAFNTSFKKMTGVSPSEFQKSEKDH